MSSRPRFFSLLCAAAFCPLIAAGAGVAGAGAVAGIGVVSSVGGGVLSGVIASALPGCVHAAKGMHPHRWRSRRRSPGRSGGCWRPEINAQVLRGEIAAVLGEIDAGGTMLRAAIDTGNERVRSDVIAAIGVLGAGFAELGFLIEDVARAAAEIQESLDEQGATPGDYRPERSAVN